MIIFQPPRLTNVLRVDRRNFFSLLGEDDHFYTAELTYEIRQSAAVTQKANRVKITAYSSLLLPERYINDPSKPTDTVNSLLTYAVRNIMLQRDQSDLLLGTTSGDIFGAIDKRVFTQLSSGRLLGEIPEAKKTVMRTELKSESDKTLSKKSAPIPSKKEDADERSGLASLNRDLMRKDKIDPAKAIKFFSLKQSKAGLKAGINETKSDSFNSKIKALEYTLSRDPNPVLNRVTFTTVETQEYVTVKSQIKIKKHDGGRVQFRFELITTESDFPVDVQEYSADIVEGSRTLKFLFHPPEVTSTRTSGGVVFGLKQTNKWGTSVRVFSKNPPERSGSNNRFTSLGSVRVNYGETGKFFVPDDERANRVFRFVCANETSVSPRFESCVISPIRKTLDRREAVISLDYTDSLTTPFLFTLSSLPETALTAQFKVKNLSRKSRDFKVAGDLCFIRHGDSFVSSAVTNRGEFRTGNTYQVICVVQHSNGLYTTEGGDIFTFHDPRDRDNTLQIEILEQELTGDNITFQIRDGRKETQTEIVKKILKAKGDYALFQGEVEENKEGLENLVAHQVERINLTTGARESLGVIPSGDFSDIEQSRKMGIPPADKNQSYRYSIKTLSAKPEILFGDYRKEVKDKCETKVYTYFPSKFLNFWSLKRGLIPGDNKSTLTTSYSGITKTWDYIPTLEGGGTPFNLEARLYDLNHIEISFKVNSANQFYDHFVLSKVINGDKIPLDPLHSQFTSEQRYLYRISPLDRGEISFSIDSVKNDYGVTSQILSNTLTL
jgi:predicted secreted protein